ncbi:hypothetical protein [Streptomyces sp. NBC_00467]|uniref:hypothetical protein n=1 Tax=Streptomyces sp. NBC_00467 TaxID=2975752 RepID=UPI002E175BD0
MTRHPARCPASPLLAVGAILTLAGATSTPMPGERPKLYASTTLVVRLPPGLITT